MARPRQSKLNALVATCHRSDAEVLTVNQRQRSNPRHDTTLNAALGCAAAISLVIVVILIVYLWTL